MYSCTSQFPSGPATEKLASNQHRRSNQPWIWEHRIVLGTDEKGLPNAIQPSFLITTLLIRMGFNDICQLLTRTVLLVPAPTHAQKYKYQDQMETFLKNKGKNIKFKLLLCASGLILSPPKRPLLFQACNESKLLLSGLQVGHVVCGGISLKVFHIFLLRVV